MRLWAERFAPLMAAPETASGAAPAPPAEAAPAQAAPAVDASTAAAPIEPAKAPEKVEPKVEAKAEPKAEEKPEIQPSLLEAAAGKPKADAKADAKASPEPAPEAKPAEAKAEDKKPDAKAEAKPEAKADEKKADAKDPATDATVQPEPPAPVKYEAFKVPEGIKLDDKKLSSFTDLIGAAQVKQEDAQKLIDLYIDERKADGDAARAEQRRVWNALNDGWKTDLRKDPVLGGNRLETSLSMAKAVVEEYGGSPEQIRELLAHTSNNGMGNYPGFVRLLHNIGVALNVFEDSMIPANPSPPKAEKGPGKRGWYPSMGNGASQP